MDKKLEHVQQLRLSMPIEYEIMNLLTVRDTNNYLTREGTV